MAIGEYKRLGEGRSNPGRTRVLKDAALQLDALRALRLKNRIHMYIMRGDGA